MKKYLAKTFYNKIDEVEILRETDHYVYIIGYDGNEKRESKSTSHDSYFDTYKEAKDWFLKLHNDEIESLERQLNLAKEEYNYIEKTL